MSLFSAKLASLFVDIVVNSRRANNVIHTFTGNVKKSGQQLNTFRQQMLVLGLASSAFLLVMKAGHLLNSTLQSLIDTSRRLEKNFLEVQKNLHLSADGFKVLQKETLQFTTNVSGIDLEAFQQVLITSSRMGIEGSKNLMDFSKAVALVARVSEGVSESNLAEFMFRLEETFGRTASDTIYLGNTLVSLSAILATNEQQIIDVTQKLMGSADVLGLTAEEAMAFAAAAKAMGITSERASSMLARLFQVLASDPLTFGRTLFENEQAAIDFARTVESEPAKAVQILFKRFKEISASGVDFQAVLKKVDLEDRRVAESIKIFMEQIRLADIALEDIARSQGNVNELQAKSGEIADGLDQKLTRLNNAWERLKASLGNVDAFKFVINELTGLLNILSSISEMQNPIDAWFATANPILFRTAQLLNFINKQLPKNTGVQDAADAAGPATPAEAKDQASRTDVQLAEEIDAQIAETEKLQKELEKQAISLIENTHAKEMALENESFLKKEADLAKLHDERKINLEQWHELQKQLEKEHNERVLRLETERLKEQEKTNHDIVKRQDKDSYELLKNKYLKERLLADDAYFENLDRLKDLLEKEKITKENYDKAVKREDAIHDETIRKSLDEEARDKKVKAIKAEAEAISDWVNKNAEAATKSKEFAKSLRSFTMTDKEQEIAAIKDKFEEIKKQAKDLGRQDLFPELDKAMKIEIGKVGQSEARFSGIQDIWKNAQLEFLNQQPKEELAVLKEIALGQEDVVQAIKANKPIAAVGN